MKNQQKGLNYWLFLLPSLLALLLVVIIPFAYGIFTSFTNFDGFKMAWVGIDNYLQLLEDRNFLESLWFTVRFSLVSIVLVNVIGLSLGLLVTARSNALTNFFRTAFFVPNLIGGIILGFIWQFVFIQAFSAISQVTGWEFFNGWLANEATGFWALVIVFLWQMSGYVMIIYVAFLNDISNDVLEAAKIDGAGAWQMFWRVKFPLVAPAFTISLFITLANAFKVYDLNLTLTNGGPFGSTEMLAMNIFNTAFEQYSQGYAQAKGIVFFLIVAILTGIQMKFTQKREVDV
ncbi:MAG: carbohydrate ABC transporter permease [Bavariicoccus seileri]|uniref:carbohydrate ABC transporter permease n=1 Tax=Bavariicoccus seileri TaxID=549685 RepID=UPI003F9216D4